VKYEERGADGEWQDHASGDLVERSVNEFKGIVAETETDNIKTNHWNEPLDGLLVKVQRNFQQATRMAGQEEYYSDDELCK